MTIKRFDGIHTCCDECKAEDVPLYGFFGEHDQLCEQCVTRQMNEYFNSAYCTFSDKCSMFDVKEIKYE